jgi:hypothetical protein
MIRTAIAGLAATAALATGVAVSPTPAAFAKDEQTACERVWEALPANLQADIAAAVALPPRAQHRAMVAIRHAALHGTYGAQVQQWAERLRARRVEIYRSFPAQLKADIRAARSLPYREQRRAVKAIRIAALEGVYGEDVQQLAERRQAFYEGCSGVAESFVGGAADPLAG